MASERDLYLGVTENIIAYASSEVRLFSVVNQVGESQEAKLLLLKSPRQKIYYSENKN
jgi:hypothetical protein